MSKSQKISLPQVNPPPPQKKSKSVATKVVSAVLALLAAYFVFTVISIEVNGRRGVVSADEWKELIKKHPYQRKETDLRSPCPMLNTLANHGFIARDGRNIRSEDLFDALMLMGAPPSVSVLILNYVYFRLQEPQPQDPFWAQFRSLKTLDLDRLTIFDVLEHDVSLTRNDTLLAHPDTTYVVPAYVERMIKLAEMKNQGKSKGFFTRENEHDVRKLRWLESIRDNRHMHLDLFAQFASSTECSLLLDIIGRDGSISLPHLKSFLLHEAFPEDWHPRETTFPLKHLIIKPMICWHGLRKSQVSLDLIDEL
ncbi:Chloroperoxidase [Parasitella parasitica]|nr:Chloroperoxidase [Parasitella parasitica]